MTAHLVAPLIEDHRVPRMHPCQAKGVGPGAVECGATPASLWRRTCLGGHDARVRLCGTHALLILTMNGGCAECIARGYASPALLQPLDLLLLGHAAGPPPRTGPALITRKGDT